MPDTCTVSADDVKAVAGLLSQAKVLSQWLTAMPGFDAAFAAAARMCGALDQTALPESPVSAFEQMAIIDRHTYEAYRAQDFDDEQAFHILAMMIAMRCNLTLAAAAGPGNHHTT